MKKLFILALCMIMILGMNTSVFAGEYDINEQYVIQQISGDAFPVKVKQQYINQLQNYFLQEEVSLSKVQAQDFVDYLKKGLIEKENPNKSFERFSAAYQNFQKAGDILGLYVEYDSAVNDFYAIDQSGYIVIDSQPVIKNTDSDEKQDWNISIEAIFAVAVCLCILGILANVRRWNRKLRLKNKKKYEEEDEDEDELEVANRKTRKARLQTFSYKSVKQVLRYFYIPIIMGLIVIGIGTVIKSNYNDIWESISANFINTQPLYKESQDKNMQFSGATASQESKVQLSSVVMPKYGEQYGVLESKKLSVNAPVYFGDRGELLEKGAGSYIGSFLPGQNRTILIGAHDTTYFEGLKNVKEGDRFKFTTAYGVYKYEVTKVSIVHRDNYDEAYNLGQNREQLILYTCYPFGRFNGTKEDRMFVYLDRISGPVIAY